MSFVAFSAAIDDRATGTATAAHGRALSSITLGTGPRGSRVNMASKYANRHGLITGATGSGKTCSMLRFVSEFNRCGVPVFAPDMKGDLATLISASIPAGVPAVRLVPGVNFRLSLRRLGGDLTARALGLSDAQRGALESYLNAGCESPAAIKRYPHRFASTATERAMARGLDRLDSNNFGSASFDIADLIVKPSRVHVFHARDIAEEGATYAAFITFMLRDLYRRLPEVGDRALPVLAFFIDEAHMLFSGAPPELVAEIERMVRLIRSRGVSLWFVTQSPADLSDTILAQLQNRIQHSLRAVTPKDWRGVRAAVDTMPPGNFGDPVKLLGTLAPRQSSRVAGRVDGPARRDRALYRCGSRVVAVRGRASRLGGVPPPGCPAGRATRGGCGRQGACCGCRREGACCGRPRLLGGRGPWCHGHP